MASEEKREKSFNLHAPSGTDMFRAVEVEGELRRVHCATASSGCQS